MSKDHGLTQRQACRCVGLAPSTAQYQKHAGDDRAIIERLGAYREASGDRGMAVPLPAADHGSLVELQAGLWVYALMRIRRRARERLPARVKQALLQPAAPDQVWSIDFMHDTLWDGRSYRSLNVIDDYNRHILWIEVTPSYPPCA